jgi:hypothetical protein
MRVTSRTRLSRTETLRHGWDGGEHLRKLLFGDIERPGVADAITVAAVALHPGERQQAGELTDARDEQREVAALGAAHMNLTGEQDVHAKGRISLAEDHGSRTHLVFGAVVRKPEVVLVGETVEALDFAQGGDDPTDRSRPGGEGALPKIELGRGFHCCRVYLGGAKGRACARLLFAEKLCTRPRVRPGRSALAPVWQRVEARG